MAEAPAAMCSTALGRGGHRRASRTSTASSSAADSWSHVGGPRKFDAAAVEDDEALRPPPYWAPSTATTIPAALKRAHLSRR